MVSQDEQLDQIFAALADPTRRAILARLARGDATVMELAEPFDISLPAISKHLKVLERAGLISRGRDAQWRPCRLETAPLKEAQRWIDTHREIWEESFSRLDDLLQELQAGNGPTESEAPKRGIGEPIHRSNKSRKELNT
jgi:DNA-binding transcriptional ArsR family regulator